MKRLTAILFITLSMTSISLTSVGKAMVTPYHLLMILVLGYVTLFSRKSHLSVPFSLIALGSFLVLNNVINYPNIRYTSLIYSLAFLAELVVLYNLLKSTSRKEFRRILVLIFVVYFANISLATIALAAGETQSLLGGLIGITQTASGSRPCGFSSEPSYAAFVICICFLCWNRLNTYQFDRKFIWMSIGLVLSIFMLGSAYGILLLCIIAVDVVWYYLKAVETPLKIIVVGLVVILTFIGINLFQSSDNESIVRVRAISEVLSNDTYTTEKMMKKLQETDPSAFARIGTTYYLFKDEDKLSDFLLGKGAGAAGDYIPQVMAGFLIDEDDKIFDTGVIPAFIFDYGFIGFTLLILFAAVSFRGLTFSFWLMFILLLPNANINTQLFWFLAAAFLGTSLIGCSKEVHSIDFSSQRFSPKLNTNH